MQIHEITLRQQVDEGLGAGGSFLSGLTGGMSDKYMDKTPGGVKPGFASSGVNPADYGAGYKKPSAEWKDKYKALQTDPTVSAYVKTIAPGWVKYWEAELKKTQTTKPAAGAGAFSQMANQLGSPTIHEAMAPAAALPNANQLKATFQNWSDGQFATRVQETGATVTMDAVRTTFPDLAKDLSNKLNQIAATQGTPQQAQAIEEYAKLAVAGVQALAQVGKNKESVLTQQDNVQFANTSGDVRQSLRQAGVDPDKLAQFGAQTKEAGNPMTARRSDNPALNTLAKLAGFTLT